MEKLLNKYCSPKQKEWAWFVILWCGGLGAVMLLGFIIRTAMGIE
jgi:hypothetical protein